MASIIWFPVQGSSATMDARVHHGLSISCGREVLTAEVLRHGGLLAVVQWQLRMVGGYFRLPAQVGPRELLARPIDHSLEEVLLAQRSTLVRGSMDHGRDREGA